MSEMKQSNILENNVEEITAIRRCTKCLLPETFPYIEFDDSGVCNYCQNHSEPVHHGASELKKITDKYRGNGNEPDCIVMFSGGRDSSYALHYVKTVLGMNPIAFTYDWGMSTDVGAENQKLICDKLSVEQILVKADIAKKHQYIRQNVLAWLKKPHLGMVPLFMAGDKHFFYHINKVANERNIKLVFLGVNPYEKTDFKTGFCNIPPNFDAKRIYSLSFMKKVRLISFYLSQFIKNPSYINSSIVNTIGAFFSFYGIKQDQEDIYNYIPWDEKTINDTLINTYGWKMADDNTSTWRIGDGTAAFYNYIYYTVAGFTENDTLRSNQIRSGAITREEGLEFVNQENLPRDTSLKWYLDMIGVDYEYAINTINSIPKMYRKAGK